MGPPGTRSPTFFRLALRPPGPPGQEAMRQHHLLGVLVLRAQGQGAEQLRVVGRAAVVEHVRQLQRLHVAPLSEHLQARRDPGGSGPCWGSTHTPPNPPSTHPHPYTHPWVTYAGTVLPEGSRDLPRRLRFRSPGLAWVFGCLTHMLSPLVCSFEPRINECVRGFPDHRSFSVGTFCYNDFFFLILIV